MQKRTVTVNNQIGIRARTATIFLQKAGEFESSVHIKYKTALVNGKSLLGILSAQILGGSEIEIWTDGADELAAADALVDLVNSGFIDY
ncbi:MAG: HPr family phosphocarrier protein [Clostridia bacterium]|nr:HPr family phosphocarrier protein [Clostridia bacterium]